MNGRGKLYYRNGNFYEGYMRDNQPIYGIFYKNEGYVYIGGFKGGLDKQGYGEQYWIDGECFKGNFIHNVRDGKGEYIWQDGNQYLGDYKQNLRHGYGEMKWDNGDWYKG